MTLTRVVIAGANATYVPIGAMTVAVKGCGWSRHGALAQGRKPARFKIADANPLRRRSVASRISA